MTNDLHARLLRILAAANRNLSDEIAATLHGC